MIVKKTIPKVIGLLLLTVHFGNPAGAQKLELGISAGAAVYTGDLAPGINIANFRQAAQVFTRLHLNKYLAAKFSGSYGRLAANDSRSDDPFPAFRDFQLKNNILELAAVLEYDFFDTKGRRPSKNWTPYAFGGMGFAFTAPSSPKNLEEDHPKIQPVIPLGAGVKININRRFLLSWEFGARFTFTDFIDNVSRADPLSGIQRGNPNDNDRYYFTMFSVGYKLFKIPCPICD